MEDLKGRVRIEDYARELTDLYFSGQSLRGICPIHGGENRSSFAVYPEKQRWQCFRCDQGGDVVDLYQAVENHIELWTAMHSLAQRFGVKLPVRPNGWKEWQNQKGKGRNMIQEALIKKYQRRLFRMVWDASDGAEAPEEQELGEARRLFRDLRPAAEYFAALRLGRRHAG